MTPRVFVDTSAFIALAYSDDEHHVDAQVIAQALERQRARLYTTNFVIAETHALMLRRLGHVQARHFLRQVDAGQVAAVVRATIGDEEAAKALIYRYTDKEYSLTDAISFTMMTRLRLKTAFAFDKHFGQYGWQILEPNRDK